MGIPTGAAVASGDAVTADIAASTGTGNALVDNVYFQEVAGENDNDGLMIEIFSNSYIIFSEIVPRKRSNCQSLLGTPRSFQNLVSKNL